MKLYGTPISHFARKVRILLDLYSVPYEFIDVGNVAEGTLEMFAGNPLLKVPVFVDGDQWMIESDYIAGYLVQKLDPKDKYGVLSQDKDDLNVRAVLNGIMTEEVKYILAKRTGVPVDQYTFFDNALEAITNGFDWLEKNAHLFNASQPGYNEFHLVCTLEHVAHYELVNLNYPKLKSIVEKVLTDKVINKTSPFVLKPKN